jgi:DMSO reductase anchor subunit
VTARPALGTTRPSDAPTPYGRPVLKPPVWTWEIPCYFYTGGLAGASAGVSYLAELRGEEALAFRASLVALGAGLASPALLISDLGRPARFLHMLRLFKVTSPMSVGSWILSVFGACITAGAGDHVLGGRVPGGRAARAIAALLGLPLSAYTAALVANTAVPAWHESRRMLPFVFVSGAAASAGGALTALVPIDQAAPARRLAVAGAVTELVLKETMEHRLGELSDAYKEGPAHPFGLAGRTLIAAGGAVIALSARRSRPAAVVGGALLNLGALAARWSIYKAGFSSAENPRHTVDPQRARLTAERG